MDVPSQSVKDLWEPEALGSSPSHSPSWSLAQRLLSSHPNMKHCLEIHVTLTEELGAVPPPFHSWTAPLMEDMLCDARTGLTKAVVTDPGRAVLFYGRFSMEEGLTADEARDATFLLTGAGTWVGKLAYLAADPMTIQEGRRAIAQAMSAHWVKARDQDIPVWIYWPNNPSSLIPQEVPLWRMCLGWRSDHPSSPCWSSRGWERNRFWRDQRPQSPCFPSPSPDFGFKSNQSLLSMASLMLSRSDRSDGSWHPRRGREHQEEGAHMKINLPIFKDEDAKDAVTYQCWRWDLMVYWCEGCRDHTILPYAIRSLQGYPGELVWSSGIGITLDNVLTILDEHYNNMKALDALKQELFQLWMANKETVLNSGIHLSRHLQVLTNSFPDHFPPDHVAELKRDCLYGRLSKWLKAMVAYLKVGPQLRMYSDYLRATREAEKEDSIELPWDSRTKLLMAPQAKDY